MIGGHDCFLIIRWSSQCILVIILDIPFIWWEIFNLKIKLLTISEQSHGDSEQFDGDSLNENVDEPQY